MNSKIIKTLILLFFAGVVAFAAITFLATDLSAEIVYHEAYLRRDYTGRIIGIECKDAGKTCKIEIIGKVPYLRD